MYVPIQGISGSRRVYPRPTNAYGRYSPVGIFSVNTVHSVRWFSITYVRRLVGWNKQWVGKLAYTGRASTTSKSLSSSSASSIFLHLLLMILQLYLWYATSDDLLNMRNDWLSLFLDPSFLLCGFIELLPGIMIYMMYIIICARSEVVWIYRTRYVYTAVEWSTYIVL